jgi:membrane fusion protein, multidrug efflux system
LRAVLHRSVTSFAIEIARRSIMAVSNATKYKKTIATAGVLAAVAAAVLFAFGLPGSGIEAAEQPASPPAIPVEVATVAQREVTTWDEFSGRLEAVERVEVRSRVAGAVQSIHFVEGALVKRGDLLVRIDPDPYAAAVERAQAQVVAAQARLEYTRSEHQRAQRLWDAAAIAQRELDERANAEREADANLRAAQAALQSARLDLGYTEVRAPVAGRVGKLEITVGNLVAAGPGAPVLTTLVSIDPMYASFDAGETIIARALKDSPTIKNIPVEMEIVTNGGTRKRGQLQLIDNQVNPRTGTVRVRAVFDNRDGALMAGQFVKLRMGRAKTESAILVAERAVGTDQSKRFVMVVGPDDKAAYREVTLGTSVEGQRIVTSGLEPGERIVVNGLQRVRPGALLSPQPAAVSAASSMGAS